jgi:leucine-rich repeat protein SHOC2
VKKIIDKILAEKETIKKVNLSEQYSLTEIPEVIGQCFQLEKLDVSFTGILEIPDFVFRLPNLKELNYLGCAEIQSQPNMFSSKQPLEKLSMYISKGQSLPVEIANLKNIKSLTISGELKEVPKIVYRLSNIEELQIFDSKISTLSAEVENLSKLKKLAFWQPLFSLEDKAVTLKLEEIFCHVSKCKNLKELYLDNNSIKTIPENVSLLSQLQVFSIKDNLLVSYPDALYKLKNLKELDLGTNKLKEVVKGIGSLAQLKILRLNSNWKNKLNVENLFNEIAELLNLEILELWSCQSVKEVPEAISSLKKLKKLDLDNNLLKKLPKSILSMPQLKMLRISTNKIQLEEINELKKYLTSTKIIA